MAEQRHGRFYAQELMIDPAVNISEQIQDALDAGERLEWKAPRCLGCVARARGDPLLGHRQAQLRQESPLALNVRFCA
jgi:hypothetical protein